MAGALDRTSQHALMARAGSGLAAGADLAIVRDKAPKHVCLFVINVQAFVSAKLTGFWFGKVTALAGAAFIASFDFFFSHDLIHSIN